MIIILFIYIYLINIKSKFCGKSFGEKIRLINQCKNEEQYSELSIEKQDELFLALQSLK